VKLLAVLLAALSLALCTPTTGQTPTPAPGQSPASQSAGAHLRFAQIADTHLGILDNFARTRRIIDAINAWPDKIDFVAHTGDITHEKTDSPLAQQARDLLGGLKPPLHCVPGNHDILGPSMCEAYRSTFGPLCGKEQVGQVVCLFFYCEPICHDVAVAGYNPWNWLEDALRDAGDKPVIIFMHTPTIADPLGNLQHVGWPRQATQRFSDLINAHNVKGVIAGHLHADKDYMLGKVPVFVASSVSGILGRHGCFRVYDYADGKLTYRTVYK